MQGFLKKHNPGVAHHSLKVSWTRTEQTVSIDFQVQKRDGKPWVTSTEFGDDWRKNWGLWDKDVFEAFLQLRNSKDDIHAPYLELQVSPANQPFALLIVEPRKTFHAPENLEFTTKVEIEGRALKANLTVTLPSELRGDKLFGGFFSCLGEAPREFFALEPNPEEKPDFHRPELFISLD
jgi:hypothetical protein